MSTHDWMVVAIILGAAFLVTGALLTVVLLAAAARQADDAKIQADTDRAYIDVAQHLLRSEAEVERLRRQLIRPVPTHIATRMETIRNGITAAQQAARIDDEWEHINKDGA